MILFRFRWFLLLVVALLTCFGSYVSADEDSNENDTKRFDWFLTVYGGAHAQDDIGDVFTLQPKFEDNDYLVVVALARELWHFKKYISFELEGQIGKHFNNDTFWEFNGLIIGRWHVFPWDKYFDTSFAVGDGISHYTEVSKVEKADDEDSQRTINYLLFELALGLPQHPRWDVVLRIHHRSGIFGVYEGGGSNYVTGGFKFSF